jgi:hypothetical protein
LVLTSDTPSTDTEWKRVSYWATLC